MKNITTLLFSTFLSTIAIAQCNETVSDFGNNSQIPAYNIEGDVTITLNEDTESLTLDLAENFMTAAGPDIRAFFVNSNGLSDAQLANTLISNLENIQFGLVGNLSSTNQNGAKSFTIDIPEGTILENFDTIFFYCLQFDQFWDFGKFTPFTSENCNLLDIEATNTTLFSLTPNPARNIINIEGNELNNSEVRIFSQSGREVYNSVLTQNNQIDIANLARGLYLVSVSKEGQNTIQKLVIQ